MMKKIKVKSLEELFEGPDDEEWTEVEFTEPLKVKSIIKKLVKTKA